MKEKTNFFKVFITSIYDLDKFIEYAKEGFIKGIIYILIVCTALGIIKGGILGYSIIKEIVSINDYIESNRDEAGLMAIDFNINDNNNSRLYIDSELSINNDAELKNIFNNNKNLLILKDGVALNNYGSIYKLNYSEADENLYNKNSNINTENKVLISIPLKLILINIIEILKNLVINYIVIVTAALLVSIFMRMLVKYKALWLLVIYSSTLPLIIITVLSILKPNVNYDITFIGGTLTYVIIILKYIKSQIIENITKQKF